MNTRRWSTSALSKYPLAIFVIALASVLFGQTVPAPPLSKDNVGANLDYSAQILSLWPVSGAAPGARVRLWAQVGNITLYALPSNAAVWFWVTGPNWSGTHWVASAPIAGLSPGTEQWYSFDWLIPANAPQGDYSYWAQAWTSVAISDWSQVQGFEVTSGITPGKATLLLPSGATPSNPPTYTWTAVNAATWYYLWVDDKTNSPKIQKWYTAAQAKCGAGTGICSAAPGVALPVGSAQWWVQTWNQAGYGPWSDATSFRVVDVTTWPVAYWPLNGGLSDLSGRSNGGTLLFRSSTYSAFKSGRLDRALDSAGGAYGEVADSPVLSAIGANFTIEAWIYLNYYPVDVPSITAEAPIVNKWGPGMEEDDEYRLAVGVDKKLVGGLSSQSWNGPYGYVELRSSTDIPLKTWTHVAFVLDASAQRISLLINGQVDASSIKQVVADRDTGTPVRIGYVWQDPPGPLSFDGFLDEIRIWKCARTPAQIQAAMNTELP